MYYDETIFNKPDINKINDTKYNCKIFNKITNQTLNFDYVYDKKQRKNKLILLHYLKKKNKKKLSDVFDQYKNLGILLNDDLNIILDIFRVKHFTKRSQKEYSMNYLKKPDKKKHHQVYNKIRYYKKKNKPIPDKYLEEAKIYNVKIN